METLCSQVDATSDAYAANRKAQRELALELKERLARAALGGPQKSRERHVARGKLLPRERIDQLLDEGSPFLEIAPLAASGMYDDDSPGAGVIAGIGLVHGRQVLVISNDATVKGGTYYPMTVKSTSGRRKSPSRTVCHASIWWTPAAPSCPGRTRSFRTRNTSAGSSTTRRGCRRRKFRRSPPSWVPAPQAEPTFPP